MKKQCPGMDPANWKFEDISIRKCPGCSSEIEFWKDDVKLTCQSCGLNVFNPALHKSCLSWCPRAGECISDASVDEWIAARDNA
jgi:hypothetical protein